MAKKKVIIEEEVVPEVKEEVVVPEVKEEVVAPKIEVVEPEVAVTGHFYAVKRAKGFVVVNRLGQIVSQPMDETKAIETAQRYEGLTR